MTPEGRVKVRVKKALDTLTSYRFMPVQNGMGAPGLDFFCCVNGLFVAVETKVLGKRLTPRQRQTADEIVQSGGVVFGVRDDADIVHMLQVLNLLTSQRGRIPGTLYDTLGD